MDNNQNRVIDGDFPGSYNEERQRKGKGRGMEKKLLFFDIDGTLISEKTGKLPESTREALKEAKNQGCLLFVNTGRTKISIPKEVKELGFDGYVCGCGTNIYFQGKKLFTSQITNARCREVALRLREMKLPVFYEADDAIYFDYKIPAASPWIRHAQKAFGTMGKDLEELLAREDLVYDKFLMILNLAKEGGELQEFLSQDFQCIDRRHDMWEVTQKSCSKGTGIHFLCEYMGIPLKNCYAFGDSENDRAMLEAVPNSIAMGNGEEAIKKSCSYVTDEVEKDGILHALKHLRLIP